MQRRSELGGYDTGSRRRFLSTRVFERSFFIDASVAQLFAISRNGWWSRLVGSTSSANEQSRRGKLPMQLWIQRPSEPSLGPSSWTLLRGRIGNCRRSIHSGSWSIQARLFVRRLSLYGQTGATNVDAIPYAGLRSWTLPLRFGSQW